MVVIFGIVVTYNYKTWYLFQISIDAEWRIFAPVI